MQQVEKTLGWKIGVPFQLRTLASCETPASHYRFEHMGSVMVNFMCQLDWAMVKHILGVSAKVFWMVLTFQLGEQVKQIVLPNVGGPHPNSWRPK